MGIIEGISTLVGALTPICDECGITLCWDISLDEYLEKQEFWDNWCCDECSSVD
jgi:hypothetical protein